MMFNQRRPVGQAVSKVPEVTFGFWVIKIAATTLGETGGDWVTMSLSLGYLIGTGIFTAIFVGLVAAQINAGKFRPFLYWATIVATTTLGTTIADFTDRSLGIGYPGGVAIVLSLLLASLAIWYWVDGTVSVQSITSHGSSGSTGAPSCFHRRSARHSATGSQAPTAVDWAWATNTAQSSSALGWRWWPRSISGRDCRAPCCFGRLSF